MTHQKHFQTKLTSIFIALSLLFTNHYAMAKSKIQKISNTVYQIDLGAVNCFVVEDSTGLTLIDTGYEGDEAKIYRALSDIGRQAADLKQIVLTHLHADHAGAAASIQGKLKIPIYASPTDGALLAEGVSLRANTKTTKGLLNKILKKLFVKDIQTIQVPDTINYVADGQVLPLGKGIEVHFTPGHSAGHMSLLVKADQLLIAGDICANNVDLSPSIVNEDLEVGLKTLQQLKVIDFDKACFGHGKPLLANAKVKLLKKFGGN